MMEKIQGAVQLSSSVFLASMGIELALLFFLLK